MLLAAGADIVFCHGPHQVGGIELVRGKPIFYGLGDFVFQVETISRHPAESYERLGLGDEATPADLVRASRESWHAAEREAYEGCAAALRFRGGQARGAPPAAARPAVRCAAGDAGAGRAGPMLRWDARSSSGSPQRSQRFGTEIRFDAARNQGSVAIV